MVLAEQTGIIHALAARVLEAAIARAAEWRWRRLAVGVAVTISARNLQDAGLPEFVGGPLRHDDLPTQFLKFKSTESSLMTPQSATLRRLGRLREMGIRVAIDDFGTGCSSRSFLILSACRSPN